MTPATPVPFETYRGILKQVSNWGRWGADDERGTLNFITPAKRTQAAGLVREGVTIGLSAYLPTRLTAPQVPAAATHLMTGSYDNLVRDDAQGARVRAEDPRLTPGVAFVTDYLAMDAHAHQFTHLDALCHVAWEGKVYNGKPCDAVFTSRGAVSMGIDVAKDGIVSRAILLDIPRVRGVEWVEPGEAIGIDDLERAERAAGVKVESGDILLVRTGRYRRQEAQGPWDTSQAMPGLDVRTLPWIHERQVAAFGCDSTSEIYPPPVDGIRIPMHVGFIPMMGMHLMDGVYMEEVSRACAERKRWEFMLTVAPLKLKGGTGLAVNPIAVF